MSRRGPAMLAGLILTSFPALLSACAVQPFGAAAAPQPLATVADDVPDGYLTSAAIEALARSAPPPPIAGSEQDAADRSLSDRYRAYQDGDRWLLATAHAELSPEMALQHFDCALGVRFAGSPTPRLIAAFERVLHDVDHAAELAKARAFRARPVGDDPERPACQRVSEAGRASPSYPSGSAAVGAAYADVIAAVAPERSAEVEEIGRQIGISRLVCGMHYPTDVAAGAALGHDAFSQIAATPAFQADLEAARVEVAAVRATGLTHPGCAAERAALALSLP